MKALRPREAASIQTISSSNYLWKWPDERPIALRAAFSSGRLATLQLSANKGVEPVDRQSQMV
jgi:hypothetical protein